MSLTDSEKEYLLDIPGNVVLGHRNDSQRERGFKGYCLAFMIPPFLYQRLPERSILFGMAIHEFLTFHV
jgi:hypothetical protein